VAFSLKELQESHDVTVQWRSFELRPAGTPVAPEARARIEAGRPRLYALARQQYGIAMKAGPFGVSSRPALVGAKFAEAQGVGDAYHMAIFHAYWQEAQAIDDLAILTGVAASVGLDGVAFRTALEEPVYQNSVTADIDQAYAYGLNSAPSLVFNNKYLVVGAQPYDVLRQVADQVRHEA
jgi:predicted DsbA family dithiol-disulfide isomerase